VPRSVQCSEICFRHTEHFRQPVFNLVYTVQLSGVPLQQNASLYSALDTLMLLLSDSLQYFNPFRALFNPKTAVDMLEQELSVADLYRLVAPSKQVSSMYANPFVYLVVHI
jgi:hypothetical protein